MAVTNMKELFDKLQEYIDKKISYLEHNLEDMFTEYGLKDILRNLDEIQLVAVNIQHVVATGSNIDDVITVSRNMTDIHKVPELLEEITQQVDEAEVWYDQTRAERQLAHRWSQEEFNVPVDDGTHTGFSAYHYSKLAEQSAYQLTFKGDWDPNSDVYPTPDNHGDYWVVSDYDPEFQGEGWIPGDVLIWKDDANGQEWIHKKESVHWLQIVGKPSLFAPRPHYHGEYVQTDNLLPMSAGNASAGYPIKLWLDGTIHNSMIKLPVTYIVDWFTPVFGNEYPDTTDHKIGASWLIHNTPTEGYTFLTGQLSGYNVKDGDVIVWSYEGWIINYDKLRPETYLKRTGEYPMWGNLDMGLNKIIRVSDGVDNHDVATVGQLSSGLEDVFTKDEYLSLSSGTADQGKPIVLNEWGLIDDTMISYTTMVFQGSWDPSDPSNTDDYPDVTGLEPGAYWRYFNIDNGYTYSDGDLAGTTVFTGDYLLNGQNGFSVIAIRIEPEDYYRLDGSNPLTADFNGGGYRISRISKGINEDDAVTVKQHTESLDSKADLYHSHSPVEISPQGSGSGLDADFLDGKDSTDFADAIHTHQAGDISPQGEGSGLNADMLDDLHASSFRLTSDAIDWSELDNVPVTFPPVKGNQTTIGGIRVWADGDILNIATDDYVAP